MLRVGLGRDIHRLVKGRKFILGGLELPCNRGTLGHSDGDFLCHAIIDSLLGAAGLGDIGELYPDNEEKYKDADSILLLKDSWAKVKKESWVIVNLDCVVICEEPKILPYREKIKRSLAEALGVEKESIFIKGKTNEGLGSIGRGEAAEAIAICLLEKKE